MCRKSSYISTELVRTACGQPGTVEGLKAIDKSDKIKKVFLKKARKGLGLVRVGKSIRVGRQYQREEIKRFF